MGIEYYESIDTLANATEFQNTGNIVLRGAGPALISSSPTPRTGTKCFEFGSTAGGWRIAPTTARQQFFVSFGFRYQNTTLGNVILCEFFNSTNAKSHVFLGLNLSGQFYIARGHTAEGIDSGSNVPTTVLWTDTTVQPTDTWMHLEIYTFIDDTTGVFELRKNEATVISLTGQDTANGAVLTIDWIRFLAPFTSNQPRWYQDDIVIVDPATAGHNTWLGETRVYEDLPTSDAGPNTATPSTGSSHFEMVNDSPKNDDTDYNRFTASGNIEMFGFPALPSTVGAVFCVKNRSAVRKDDAGGCTMQTRLSSAGGGGAATIVNGASVNPGTTYQFMTTYNETDPDTGSAWTRTNAGNVLLGLERVA